MSRRIIIFNLILFSFFGLAGQTAKYSNEFLSLGVGARALAMSSSITATTSDIYSTYWNPAGLVFINNNKELSAMHSEYFAGIAKYDYAAFASKSGTQSAIAFSLIRFGVDNIPNTSQLIDAEGNINYDKVTAFSAADYAFIISFSHKSDIEGLSYGVNTKIVRRTAGNFAKSWGFGIDLGSIYKKENWIFGLMLRDITTTFNSWTYTFSDEMIEAFKITGNVIPQTSTEITMPTIIISSARSFDLSKNFNFLTEFDANISTDGKRNVLIKSKPLSIDPHLGLELGYKKVVFVRAGIGNIQKETSLKGKMKTSFQPNIGLGVVIKKTLTIDYALTDIGNQSIALYSNVFSLKLSFNTKSDNSIHYDK